MGLHNKLANTNKKEGTVELGNTEQDHSCFRDGRGRPLIQLRLESVLSRFQNIDKLKAVFCLTFDFSILVILHYTYRLGLSASGAFLRKYQTDVTF